MYALYVFQKGGKLALHEKIKNMLDEIVNGNSTFMLAFTLTDMFAIIFMFLIYELPVEIVICCTSFVGVVISGIIMNKITSVPGIERGESLVGKLSYFPVDISCVKKLQYKMAFKITGIQLAFTLAPILFMCFRFKWQNAVAALVSTAVSMLFTAILLIEINHIIGRRK